MSETSCLLLQQWWSFIRVVSFYVFGPMPAFMNKDRVYLRMTVLELRLVSLRDLSRLQLRRLAGADGWKARSRIGLLWINMNWLVRQSIQLNWKYSWNSIEKTNLKKFEKFSVKQYKLEMYVEYFICPAKWRKLTSLPRQTTSVANAKRTRRKLDVLWRDAA